MLNYNRINDDWDFYSNWAVICKSCKTIVKKFSFNEMFISKLIEKYETI